MIINNLRFQRLNEEAILDISSKPVEYGSDYFEEFKRRSISPIAQRLYTFRKAYAESLAKEGPILDYGAGYGVIVLADKSNRWRGTDINPLCKKHLGNKCVDESVSKFNNVCFFDVLEHFKDPIGILKLVKGRIFISVPLKSSLKNLPRWKHWKPGEHLMYATPVGLQELVESCGYQMIDHNTMESSIGRQDIHSFCFERNQ